MSVGIARDDIDKYFQYNIYLPTKTLYMGSVDYTEDSGETGTDHGMAEIVIKGLNILDRVKSDVPITVIINNPGGDEYHGYAIYDAIKACNSHVITKVLGQASSMGSIILQAGDERVASENSTIMIHYGEWSYSGHCMDFLKSAEECKRQCEKMENIFVPKIKIIKPNYTAKLFRRDFSFDKYLRAAEALELNLIDRIE